MSLDSPLHLAAHPQPLDSVTVYSSPMVIPVTGPVVLDGAVAVAGSRVVHVGTTWPPTDVSSNTTGTASSPPA